MTATLTKRTEAGPGNLLFSLDVGPEFPEPLPGQFVHVTAARELALRRPFSVAGAPRPGTIELLLEIRGSGTRGLAALPEGTEVDVLGPLGTSFTIPADGEKAVLVAGGIGVAGLRLLARQLVNADRQVVLLVGARTREVLVHDVMPYDAVIDIEIATDDGSAGFAGPVTGLLEGEIPRLDGAARVYCCGPPAMIREVARMAEDADLRCEALMEEIMACGVGACRGCVIRTRHGYRTACSDGPVFDTAELVFEEAGDA